MYNILVIVHIHRKQQIDYLEILLVLQSKALCICLFCLIAGKGMHVFSFFYICFLTFLELGKGPP